MVKYHRGVIIFGSEAYDEFQVSVEVEENRILRQATSVITANYVNIDSERFGIKIEPRKPEYAK